MKPIISVIIPTYKGADNLGRAIDSVLSQDFDEYEVIVVDDNNPDSVWRKQTEVVIRSYIGNTHLIYIQHPYNKNGSAARNTGVSHARGKYVCFLDDDDIFLDGKLRIQYEYMEGHPDFQASYTWRYEPDGRMISCEKTGDLSMDLLKLDFSPTTITLMIRKECYDYIGGFDESFIRHQDFEFLLRFFQKFRIGSVPVPLSKIIGGGNSNLLHGKDLEVLKDRFLSTFDSLINELDEKQYGARREILAQHYYLVLRDHIKSHYYLLASRLFIRATRKVGLFFWRLLIIEAIRTIRRKFFKVELNRDCREMLKLS